MCERERGENKGSIQVMTCLAFRSFVFGRLMHRMWTAFAIKELIEHLKRGAKSEVSKVTFVMRREKGDEGERGKQALKMLDRLWPGSGCLSS